MRLWHAPSSPFCRKVRIVLHELHLDARVELFAVDPWTDKAFVNVTPLRKVPALLREDGGLLLESHLICAYLHSLNSRIGLYPKEDDARWNALRDEAIADGACAAAGRLWAEARKPVAQQSTSLSARFKAIIEGCLDRFEQRPTQTTLAIGEIAIACFLSYLNFRWPSDDWPITHPRLAKWHEQFERRSSTLAVPFAELSTASDASPLA